MDFSSINLHEINIFSIALRLCFATIFGGVLGIERSSKGRAAGFRTHMLVCVGAAMVMMTNQYICDSFESTDPARLGAQVISGIGFLGAGTIIVTRHNQVVGLTTAAGLWASACIGLTIGIGFYEGAVLACMFIFVIIIVLQRIDGRLVSRSRTIELYVEFSENGKLSTLLETTHDIGIAVHNVELIRSEYHDKPLLSALITMRLPKHTHREIIIENFRSLEGVRFIEAI